MNNIFKSNNLKTLYIKELLNYFWFVPCDAFLRAPEIAIWKNIKFVGPVLNIGCGDGRIDKYLFKGKKIDVAIDYDKKAIQTAKTTGLYGKTILASANKLPFKDNSFMTVISNSTFEHIKHDIGAINEAYRVLKKGGQLFITTTNSRYLETLKNMGLNPNQIKKYNRRVNHFHYRRIDEWYLILKKKGFKDIYIRSYEPDNWMIVWWKLFKLSTLKVYRRELWSYLKDSPYGKLFPKNIIARLLYLILKNKYLLSFNEPGNWIFVYAIK